LSLNDPLSFIASALAPVVSLSACAILASNAQTQYSLLVDRMRELNAERRGFLGEDPLPEIQRARLKSLNHQIPVIFRRTLLVRNAMVMIFLGMGFILLTSFLIGFMTTFKADYLALASKWSFFAGLFLVFLAVVSLLSEVFLTFRVVRYELGLFDREAARELERQARDY
jgi:hypothetical protein